MREKVSSFWPFFGFKSKISFVYEKIHHKRDSNFWQKSFKISKTLFWNKSIFEIRKTRKSQQNFRKTTKILLNAINKKKEESLKEFCKERGSEWNKHKPLIPIFLAATNSVFFDKDQQHLKEEILQIVSNKQRIFGIKNSFISILFRSSTTNTKGTETKIFLWRHFLISEILHTLFVTHILIKVRTKIFYFSLFSSILKFHKYTKKCFSIIWISGCDGENTRLVC